MAKAQPKKPQSGNDFFSKISKLKSGQKMGILIGAIVLVGVGFYFLYYQPYTAKASSLQGEINNLNSQISTEQTNINKHKPIAEYLVPVKDTFDYLSSYLPRENEIPRLMQIISDLGIQSGARVTMFAPKAPTLKNHYAEIEFSMNLEGTFLNNLKFLYNLSQMQRIINIRTVQIENPVMGDNMLMILSFRCEGSTYRLLTPDEAQQVKDSKK